LNHDISIIIILQNIPLLPLRTSRSALKLLVRWIRSNFLMAIVSFTAKQPPKSSKKHYVNYLPRLPHVHLVPALPHTSETIPKPFASSSSSNSFYSPLDHFLNRPILLPSCSATTPSRRLLGNSLVKASPLQMSPCVRRCHLPRILTFISTALIDFMIQQAITQEMVSPNLLLGSSHSMSVFEVANNKKKKR
jgi:hypothetical protein